MENIKKGLEKVMESHGILVRSKEYEPGLWKFIFLSVFYISARAGLHNLIKDLIRRRRQDNDKAEKLFIDSMLDNDFMDEEEVCYT